MKSPPVTEMTQNSLNTIKFYEAAKHYVVATGYSREIEWQTGLDINSFTETDLLREFAWVVLCSGFRESIVRRSFSFISLCFCEWESAEIICKYAQFCRAGALARFGNRRKIDAIVEGAALVEAAGFPNLRQSIIAKPIETLQCFPYIGAITAHHLAKNLGLSTAKPDRHLQHLAALFGYETVLQLCSDVSAATGDSIKVVDIVLWRFAERHSGVKTIVI